MRIALVVDPMSDENLRLAAQVGVTDIVARFGDQNVDELCAQADRVRSFGLSLSIVEGYLPHDLIVHGKPGRDEQIARICQLIKDMKTAQIPVLCYNFMPDDDWSRTSVDTPERGGAMVTSFDVNDLDQSEPGPHGAIDEASLWSNLQYFLEGVVPTAEANQIKLAAHPDDPPMSPLRHQARILTNVDAFERLVGLVPSPMNGVCFCQGSFAQMGVDIPSSIRRLGEHIHYVHFRDVEGTVPSFRETFHDNGKTDMFAAMQAYHDIGFGGPMRPDHVPVLAGETLDNAGYTILGRLFAVGYMKGLAEGVGRDV